MKYKLEIKWNGKIVLDATCTAVMAWENLRLSVQQFVNAEKAGLEIPTIAEMVQASKGRVFIGAGDDGTGRLSYNATVIEDEAVMPAPSVDKIVFIGFDDWRTWARDHHPSVIAYLTSFRNHLLIDPVEAKLQSPLTPEKVNARLDEVIKTGKTTGHPTVLAWKRVSDMLWDAKPDDSAIAKLLGEEVAVQFDKFLSVSRVLPKVADILSGKVAAMPAPRSVSANYAVATTVCYELKERADKIKAESGKQWKKTAAFGQWLKESDTFIGFCLNNFQHEIVLLALKNGVSIHRLPWDMKKMPALERASELCKLEIAC